MEMNNMARNKYPEVTVQRILDAAIKLFMEKGYEQTTIQDIINELGDLSKGAIYHHFKSKEEIIAAVTDELYKDTHQKIDDLKQLKGSTGLEKLKQMASIPLKNSNLEQVIIAAPNLLKNPRFLVQQLYSGEKDIAPIIRTFIEEGIKDGSVKANYPKQLSEVLILLLNVWLNPMVFSCTAEELAQKFLFLKEMTENMGIVIFENDMLQQIEKYRKLTM